MAEKLKVKAVENDGIEKLVKIGEIFEVQSILPVNGEVMYRINIPDNEFCSFGYTWVYSDHFEIV